MLCAMSGWAQNAKDSICVFDGTLTNVPDGTEIWVSVPNTEERSGVCTLFPVTTVKMESSILREPWSKAKVHT